MRTPRDACPGAQTCCALKSSAPFGARQDNCADSGSACKLAGVQIIPLPTLANQILARTFFSLKWATSVEKRHGLPISEARRCSACAHLFACPGGWKVLSGEFRRRPTKLAIKFRQSDRVGRRGLFEPREDFLRLHTYSWTQKWFVQILAAD